MSRAITEKLLYLLSAHGEMSAREFLSHVPRPRGDYLDFYPAATLLHAGYVSTDTKTSGADEKVMGKLGFNTHETAGVLCQYMLKPGESFEINGNARESWHDAAASVRVFITAEGFLRLDELEERAAERKQKRTDYFMSFLVAIVAALVSSYLVHHFASERARVERADQARRASPASTAGSSGPMPAASSSSMPAASGAVRPASGVASSAKP